MGVLLIMTSVIIFLIAIQQLLVTQVIVERVTESPAHRRLVFKYGTTSPEDVFQFWGQLVDSSLLSTLKIGLASQWDRTGKSNDLQTALWVVKSPDSPREFVVVNINDLTVYRAPPTKTDDTIPVPEGFSWRKLVVEGVEPNTGNPKTYTFYAETPAAVDIYVRCLHKGISCCVSLSKDIVLPTHEQLIQGYSTQAPSISDSNMLIELVKKKVDKLKNTKLDNDDSAESANKLKNELVDTLKNKLDELKNTQVDPIVYDKLKKLNTTQEAVDEYTSGKPRAQLTHGITRLYLLDKLPLMQSWDIDKLQNKLDRLKKTNDSTFIDELFNCY